MNRNETVNPMRTENAKQKEHLMRCLSFVGWLALVPSWIAIQVRAQDSPVASPNEAVSANAKTSARFAAAEAPRYDIRQTGKLDDALKLVSPPVLNWSNPTDGEVHGSVVFWTNNGCPEAAASIYQFFDRKQVNVELVSLSETPLRAMRNDHLRWSPDAGVKFMAIPDSPVPADMPRARQLQMRAIARKFTGALADRGDDLTFSVLRLMDRPLYQYESSDGSKREGAVFALVNTTDPEILLIIESRLTPNGREWLYAAARMHFCRLKLKLGDRVVWEVPQAAPPWDKIRGPHGEYVILEWSSVEAAAAD